MLDFQSVSLSEVALLGRTYWSPFSTLRHTAGVGFSTELGGSCRGNLLFLFAICFMGWIKTWY